MIDPVINSHLDALLSELLGTATPGIQYLVADPQKTVFEFSGGGGGFHSEMRIYPARAFASVLLANSTEFNTNLSLSQLNRAFFGDKRAS